MSVTVHPRVCGEHGVRDGRAHNGVGSSPRVRGTLSLAVWEVNCGWFIPACAGNTACRRT